MEEVNFTVEFHDEIEGGLPAHITQQVYEGLRKASRGRDDISHALVNVKMPAQKRETQVVYEVTVRLYMDGNDVVATEFGQTLEGTVGAAFDVIDRQVKKQRDRKSDHGSATGTPADSLM